MIDIPEARELMKITHRLATHLTKDEFINIMLIYNEALNRMIKESEEEK